MWNHDFDWNSLHSIKITFKKMFYFRFVSSYRCLPFVVHPNKSRFKAGEKKLCTLNYCSPSKVIWVYNNKEDLEMKKKCLGNEERIKKCGLKRPWLPSQAKCSYKFWTFNVKPREGGGSGDDGGHCNGARYCYTFYLSVVLRLPSGNSDSILGHSKICKTCQCFLMQSRDTKLVRRFLSTLTSQMNDPIPCFSD